MPSIYQSIETLSREKGIDPQIVLDAVKDAMLVAARKQFRATEELTADFDERTGGIQIYAIRRVVEKVSDPDNEITLQQALKHSPGAEIGGTVRIPKKTEDLGRISAQTAKQVILQKVREAERETLYSEFSGRVGEMVNCVVKRSEGLDLVVDLGKTEARLPKKEQSRLESFSLGDRARCVIRAVEKAGKNAGVIVSRASADLVVRLFEQEVPEIYDNTVQIKACAREAGERTKIAVWSRDRDVDCVGACVGMKGMRVQSIIRELRGEKIDIIEYSDDPVVFATHALSPAKISRVSILSHPERHMEVIVEDSQLSLAIGKKGQNVRLAAKLLGWRIDIKSEEEKRQEVESQMAAMQVDGEPLSTLASYGLHEKTIQRLLEAGVPTIDRLAEMTVEEVLALPGINQKALERIQNAVTAYYGPPPGENESEPQESAPETLQVGESVTIEGAGQDDSAREASSFDHGETSPEAQEMSNENLEAGAQTN
ncbi:MAG: transcription termination/antitermination protein NusA [Acidobacteria bacterium]|nr:transcription termination/antitermination protein NusA [Acidobacteriota bacterium]